jgi:hypothetical protein
VCGCATIRDESTGAATDGKGRAAAILAVVNDATWPRVTTQQSMTLDRLLAQHGHRPAGAERSRLALFPTTHRNHDGTVALTYQWFHSRFRDWIAELDLGHYVPHQARHTLATNQLRAVRTCRGDRLMVGVLLRVLRGCRCGGRRWRPAKRSAASLVGGLLLPRAVVHTHASQSLRGRSGAAHGQFCPFNYLGLSEAPSRQLVGLDQGRPTPVESVLEREVTIDELARLRRQALRGARGGRCCCAGGQRRGHASPRY